MDYFFLKFLCHDTSVFVLNCNEVSQPQSVFYYFHKGRFHEDIAFLKDKYTTVSNQFLNEYIHNSNTRDCISGYTNP